jgi:hypothetical protein
MVNAMKGRRAYGPLRPGHARPVAINMARLVQRPIVPLPVFGVGHNAASAPGRVLSPMLSR